ncbi:MAG TPA: SRPBCC domain-containing protein [Pirellulales bacterium]|nr:SRPBCC domain-containing protein [Pirellulales bacterium]
MTTGTSQQQSIETLEIQKSIEIAAPIEMAFAAMLDELGPDAHKMDGTAMPFKLEAWPGGRWFRDLGQNTGHLWGHVQVIKPPTLLEIWGPMMMSFPAINHLQYRFTAHDGGTRLTFLHRGLGFITAEHREGMTQGWGYWINRIGEHAEQKAKAR